MFWIESYQMHEWSKISPEFPTALEAFDWAAKKLYDEPHSHVFGRNLWIEIATAEGHGKAPEHLLEALGAMVDNVRDYLAEQPTVAERGVW